MPTTTDWLKVDEVMRQLTAAADMHAAVMRAEFLQRVRFELPLRGCESPLEALFALWWTKHESELVDDYKLVTLRTQVPVSVDGQNFRLDFQVAVDLCGASRISGDDSAIPDVPKIAVELDGHGFHEKTPDQVARRNMRDRLLQRDGWKVFHYSWNEMTSRPSKCVAEVWTYAEDAFAAALCGQVDSLAEAR